MTKASQSIILITCVIIGMSNAWCRATTLCADSIALPADRVAHDSIAAHDLPTDTITPPAKKRNIIQRLIDYIGKTNDERPDKKLDFSILGGPHYSSSTSLSLAVIAAGLYHGGPRETTPLSEMSVYAQGSIKGMYDVGVRGHHIFRNDKFRINYDLNFCHFPSKFWGIGYEAASQKANESKYTLLESRVLAEFQWHLPHDIYIGPMLDFYYADATKARNPELWAGQKMRTLNYGVGVKFSLDTRDFPSNAQSGINLSLSERFYPAIFGNSHACSITEITAAWYHKLWKSGTFAAQLHGAGATCHTPWALLPSINATNAMRGYYQDRYRDQGEVDIVAELRQHVLGRSSVVVWGGVATVFSKFSQIKWSTLLPTYGIGYRWEFKHRVNVRVDVGFGKHSYELTLGLNESF